MKSELNRMRNYGMQHKLQAECLNNGRSAVISKKELKHLPAFSLGEMIMVLLIMSFLAIGIPGIQFKKSEVKTQRTLHGRYECYYACPLTTDADGTVRHLAGCADDEYSLYHYSVNEEGVATGPETIAECRFTPPKEAIFFLVHAVGGGGGASTTNGSVSSCTATGSYPKMSNDIGAFPEWVKSAQGAGELDDLTTPYKLSTTASCHRINYGRSGQAGKTKSIFFPKLQNAELRMYPGRGGARNAAGSVTEVYFNEDTVPTIEAEGGAAGSGSGSMEVYVHNETSLCAIKNNDDVGYREADFATNVEMDRGSKMESKITEVQFGSGGSGSYGVPAVFTGTYTMTDPMGTSVNITDYADLKCYDPTLCNDGTAATGGVCQGTSGRNGAVVVLW